MSPQKARDLFSAAVEGSLDPGLRASFDRTLAADPHLAAEFHAFEGLYQDLHALADQPIELPYGLADRISARIDHDRWERQRARPVLGGAWLKSLALGAAASVLILGAIASLRGGGSTFTAGVSLDSAKKLPLELRSDESGLILHAAAVHGVVKVRNGETGDVIDQTAHQGGALERPLRYDGQEPILVVVEQVGQSDRLSVILPGGARLSRNQGEGTVLEAAKAAASYYRTPVLLNVADLQARVEWTLAPGPGSPSDATGSRFTPGPLALSKGDGMLVLRPY